MATTTDVRLGRGSHGSARADETSWLLKLLYAYTIGGAGAFGAWIILAPTTFASAFGMPSQDPFILGIVGCVFAAFAVVATLGLRAPRMFAPIFLVQLLYKSLWLVAVFAPLAVRGPLPPYAWVVAVVFVTYVALDLAALPFARMFGASANVAR